MLQGGICEKVGNIRSMTDGKSPDDLNNARLKHLEFIHNVIARLAGNSFWLKGWSVTLIAAIFALAARDAKVPLLFVAILPALAFWGLDAFYVGQERIFRTLHEDAAEGKVDVMFMDTSEYEKKWRGWAGDLFSRSVWPFHVPLVLVVVIAVAVISGSVA